MTKCGTIEISGETKNEPVEDPIDLPEIPDDKDGEGISNSTIAGSLALGIGILAASRSSSNKEDGEN